MLNVILGRKTLLTLRTENETSPQEKFSDYMIERNSIIKTKTKNVICDWTDEKNVIVHYKMLKFYVRHEVIFDKIHKIFFQTKFMVGKKLIFKTQKRIRQKLILKKTLFYLLKIAFYGKATGNDRNAFTKIIKEEDDEENVNQLSKLNFNGTHKSYTNYDSYTFERIEFLMDKPFCLGIAALELSKLLMYETYYDALQPYFEQENLQVHYIDTDAFVLSIKSSSFIKDLQNLSDFFDFSNFNKNHEIYKNKELVGKFKIVNAQKFVLYEFIYLRSKAYSYE